MKEQLLALGVATAPSLLAQADTPILNEYSQQSTSETHCCTNQRPCINCECYVPKFYDLECAWGFSFDAEFLYWYARETNLSYASKIQVLARNDDAPQADFSFGANTYEHAGTSWDPGFRVGIGFNSSCDGWDYTLTWTWFQNKRYDSISVDDFGLSDSTGNLPFIAGPDEFMLLNPWINASMHIYAQNTSDPYVLGFDSISADYRLRLNQIDLDIGRKYWLSKCFTMRAFAGVRSAWTRARFSTNSNRSYTSTAGIGSVFELIDTFETKALGVGLIAGIEPTWYFSQCFALYAQAGTGALWGNFEVKKNEDYRGTDSSVPGFIDPNFQNTDHNKHAQMTGLLDLGLGIRWESTWCCDRFRTLFDLGWEHHIFFDQNHRNKTADFFEITAGTTVVSGYRSYSEASGNLGFGGLVVRANFDF